MFQNMVNPVGGGSEYNFVEKQKLTQNVPITIKTRNCQLCVVLYANQSDFDNNITYINIYSLCVKDGVVIETCDNRADRFNGSGYDVSTETATINLSSSAGYTYGLFGIYE